MCFLSSRNKRGHSKQRDSVGSNKVGWRWRRGKAEDPGPTGGRRNRVLQPGTRNQRGDRTLSGDHASVPAGPVWP